MAAVAKPGPAASPSGCDEIEPSVTLSDIARLTELQRRSHWSSAEMRAHQAVSLRELVEAAWSRSAFYRAHFGAHGVRESDLRDLSIRDLPLTDKRLLLDHFDDVVTVPGLSRAGLERWFDHHRDPDSIFDERLVVVHTSGSTGLPGIFVYDREAWDFIHSLASVRFPRPDSGRHARYAFYNVAAGHHLGITHARTVARAASQVLIRSILDPLDEAVSSLNDFQPDVLVGYSSAVHLLAAEARRGRLRIRPSVVLTSADALTDEMEREIAAVWPAVVSRVYSCAESAFVAGQHAGEPWLTVLDDACWLEVVDDEGNDVAPGQSGRALLTNLYNRTMPIIRYEMHDVVTRGDPALSRPFSCITAIGGRDNTPLPILRDDGSVDTLSVLLIQGITPAGLEGAQFISERPGVVRVHYVGEPGLEDVLLSEIRHVLEVRRALTTTVTVRHVTRLGRSRTTGKVPSVVTDPDSLIDAGDAGDS